MTYSPAGAAAQDGRMKGYRAIAAAMPAAGEGTRDRTCAGPLRGAAASSAVRTNGEEGRSRWRVETRFLGPPSAVALSSISWTVLLIALVWWFTIIAPDRNDNFTVQALEPLAAPVLIVSSIGILVRRRHPVVTLALTAAADLSSVVFDLDGAGYHFGGMFGVFFVAVRYPLSRTLSLVAGPVGLVYLAEVQNAGWRWLTFAPTWVLLSTALAVAFGQVRLLREHLVRSLQDRVASVEAAQDATARARVAEDRLRTARELHDVVGHRIAVVHLRAAAAVRSLDQDPSVIRRALLDIDEAARAVLTDIDHLLADLRAGDNATPFQHDLRDLDELLAEFEGHGLRIASRVEGDPAHLPPMISEAAYYMAVEALTNALKHGGPDTTADFSLAVRHSGVTLRISNPSCSDNVTSERSGWGLHGLRERVLQLGGTLVVTPGRNFVVEVVLPTGGTA